MSAQNLPDEPDQWVTDYVGILDGRQQNQLNDMLKSFEDSTSNQIVVAIFQNAQGYPVEEFTIRLAEKWRVGQKDRDNGIVLAIFMEERKFRAEVGYGLEDVVPDAYAFQIVSQIMPSYFREGQYYEGIYEAVAALMQASAGRYEGLPRKDLKDGAPTFPFVLMVFILIIFISIFRRKKYSNANSRGWYHSGPFYWGGMGGGGFSRGGGGGFGGGGFSGGGGSFGGGGATGSW
ncbi:MAG: TPM domain-containing protein [Calditrichaeota bacterium]|nr:TPM domain-containing protein [Calditrichota bacterium]